MKKIRQAVVLAGGLGTRLRTVVQDLPKPMAPVNGRPFLEYVLDELNDFGIEEIVLAVGYKFEIIRAHFGHHYRSLTISYSIENEPLGTGGGIRQAFDLLYDEPAFVLNGDTLFKVDLANMADFHVQSNSDLTIALKPMENFDRYGTVEIEKSGRIAAFHEKKHCPKGLINGGIYLFSKSIFEVENYPEKFSFEKDLLEKHMRDLKISGFLSDAYFIDIGIPEDYRRASLEL